MSSCGTYIFVFHDLQQTICYVVYTPVLYANMSIEINRRISAAWARVRKYSSQLYDLPNAELSLKVRLLKAEVIEALLYGCATWTLRSEDFDSLRIAHHELFLPQWLDSAGTTALDTSLSRTERSSR